MPALEMDVFVREMALLHERFGRAPSDVIIARYYGTLSQRLSTSEFEAAARYVFDHDNFWPSPARFIELAKGNPKDDAEREWTVLLDACSRGDRNVLLSPEGAAAMRAVGGWNAVAYCENTSALAAKHREFVRFVIAGRENREVERGLPAPAGTELAL